jgi:hypothetical protein
MSHRRKTSHIVNAAAVAVIQQNNINLEFAKSQLTRAQMEQIKSNVDKNYLPAEKGNMINWG